MARICFLRCALIVRYVLAVLLALSANVLAPANAATSPKESTPLWRYPINPPYRTAQPYRAPATKYSAGHRGIDFVTTEGATIYAPASGSVYFAGTVVDRPVLSLDHGGGVLSSYEPVIALVTVGESVAVGQPVGRIATGGHCENRCVHFGVRVHGEYVSPLLFLGGVPRSVLLPLQ